MANSGLGIERLVACVRERREATKEGMPLTMFPLLLMVVASSTGIVCDVDDDVVAAV